MKRTSRRPVPNVSLSCMLLPQPLHQSTTKNNSHIAKSPKYAIKSIVLNFLSIILICQYLLSSYAPSLLSGSVSQRSACHGTVLTE